MEILPLIVALALIVWLAFKFLDMLSPKKKVPAPVPDTTTNDQNQAAKEAIQRVIDTCRATGGDAFDALILCATADGKVSRDELRIIIWYCQFRGATFSGEDLDQIDRLNTGVSMRVSSDTSAEKIALELPATDHHDLIRLYAAIAAIRKPWARASHATSQTLQAIENKITSPPAGQ